MSTADESPYFTLHYETINLDFEKLLNDAKKVFFLFSMNENPIFSLIANLISKVAQSFKLYLFWYIVWSLTSNSYAI